MIRVFIFLVVAVLLNTNKLTAQERTITATVVNVTSDIGKVRFALYNKDNFMMKPTQATASKIENRKSIAVFKNIPVGEYAIICYHDRNNNGKMDFSPQGMPTEDYGTSNSTMTFGPPQFDASKFTVTDKDVSLEIKM